MTTAPTAEEWEAVVEHLGLVHTQVARMRLVGADRDDAIGAGVFGLLDAVRRFDPDRGVAFSSFAMSCIWAAIGKGRRELEGVNFRRLDRAGRTGEWVDQRPVSIDGLGDGWSDLVADPADDPAEEACRRALLAEALDRLRAAADDDRDRLIVEHWPTPDGDLAPLVGIARQGVCRRRQKLLARAAA